MRSARHFLAAASNRTSYTAPPLAPSDAAVRSAAACSAGVKDTNVSRCRTLTSTNSAASEGARRTAMRPPVSVAKHSAKEWVDAWPSRDAASAANADSWPGSSSTIAANKLELSKKSLMAARHLV